MDHKSTENFLQFFCNSSEISSVCKMNRKNEWGGNGGKHRERINVTKWYKEGESVKETEKQKHTCNLLLISSENVKMKKILRVNLAVDDQRY